jgi:hypothetical protein
MIKNDVGFLFRELISHQMDFFGVSIPIFLSIKKTGNSITTIVKTQNGFKILIFVLFLFMLYLFSITIFSIRLDF